MTLADILAKHGIKAEKPNKYRNQRVGEYDSKLEMRGFGELQIREKAGEISELKLHPRFPIVWPGGDQVTIYEADASYIEGGQLRVIEWKGCMTALANLKLKLFRQAYGFSPEIIKKVRR